MRPAWPLNPEFLTATARTPERYYPFAWENDAGYERGRYVVVAGLTPLTSPLIDHKGRAQPDERVLQCDSEYLAYAGGKRGRRAQRNDGEKHGPLHESVRRWLHEEVKEEYGLFRNQHADPSLDDLASKIQEDVVIVKSTGSGSTGGTDSSLTFLHVFHPSGWDPEAIATDETRNFAHVHGPLARDMGKAVFTGLGGEGWIDRIARDGGRYRRFTWGLQFDPGLDQHPIYRPCVGEITSAWLRIERQIAVGFPEHRGMLFLIRPYVVTLAEATSAGVGELLLKAIDGMSAKEAVYKLRDRKREIVDLLRQRLT